MSRKLPKMDDEDGVDGPWEKAIAAPIPAAVATLSEAQRLHRRLRRVTARSSNRINGEYLRHTEALREIEEREAAEYAAVLVGASDAARAVLTALENATDAAALAAECEK